MCTNEYSKAEIDDIYERYQFFIGVEGKNDKMNAMKTFKVNAPAEILSKSFGVIKTPIVEKARLVNTYKNFQQKYEGIGSTRLP